jgi:hypothetical protein
MGEVRAPWAGLVQRTTVSGDGFPYYVRRFTLLPGAVGLRYDTYMEKTTTGMNLEQFTQAVYDAYDEGDEKTVALLAFEFPELYREYAIAEGLDDE